MGEQSRQREPLPRCDNATGDACAVAPIPADTTTAAPVPAAATATTAAPAPAPAVPFPVGSGSCPPDDFDLDAHIDWLVGEIDAGRQQVPPEKDTEGPAVSLSLGAACDLDPALLAAMCGPDGLGGDAVSPDLAAGLAQDGPVDALRPGPVLAALTAQAVTGLDRLTDNELIGVVQAGRRLEALAGYQQTMAIAEFARRRAAALAATAAGRPAGCRSGEFPGEELAAELVVSPVAASVCIDEATELVNRLPGTLAAMAAGTIDLARAAVIAGRTQLLDREQAACADRVLAAAAPGLRLDQLSRKAAALELKLAPEAVAARKERARREGQRVEARREESGNASLAGRELDTAEAMASDAYIRALAVRLRDSGQVAGTIGQLQARVMLDLTQGRSPLDRLSPAPPADTVPAPPPAATTPAPSPALINLLVPVGALLGWRGAAPGTAAGWGLLDQAETRQVVRAASRHPGTRWCATLVGADGTAFAHACAPGQHPWSPPPLNGQATGPQLTELAGLLSGLNLAWEPVAVDACDHRHAEPRYAPGRRLKHLLRARTQTCTAPGCGAQALYCDIDHTVPYPVGPTCQCNTGPKCRRHHRAKQAPGWRVTQPVPGLTQWRLPSGRTHVTAPTAYDV
jgi:hypothetical protein